MDLMRKLLGQIWLNWRKLCVSFNVASKTLKRSDQSDDQGTRYVGLKKNKKKQAELKNLFRLGKIETPFGPLSMFKLLFHSSRCNIYLHSGGSGRFRGSRGGLLYY